MPDLKKRLIKEKSVAMNKPPLPHTEESTSSEITKIETVELLDD